MRSELKPVRCGCGGEAVIDAEMGYELYHVFCPKCEIVTAWYKTEAEAIEAWNTAMGERTAKVENQYTVGDHGNVYEYGSCGECGAAVIKPDKYCSDCGAKLDWSDHE